MEHSSLSRRAFLATTITSAVAAPALLSAQAKPIPIGLELYSVRDVLKSDLPGTLKNVGSIGYQVVEFFSPYYELDAGIRQAGSRYARFRRTKDATLPTTIATRWNPPGSQKPSS